MPAIPLQTSKDPETVLAETEKQWIYTEDELDRAPSCVAGMLPDEEKLLRSKGVNFIIQVGVMLKLPQTTISTASVFLNRFLMRYSLVTNKKENYTALHHYQIAAVAIFLGTKVEEHPRKLKEIVIACCRVAQKNPVLIVDEQTKDYWRWKDTISHNEDLMLEVLCFDLTVESPYKVLYEIMKTQGVVHNKLLRDTAWAFLNDSGMTQLALLFTTRTIACAALYCGAKKAGVEFEDDKHGRPWWERHDVSGNDLKRAYNHMAQFFGDAPLKPGQENIYGGGLTPINGDDSHGKTRTPRDLAVQPPPSVHMTDVPSPKKRNHDDPVDTDSEQRRPTTVVASRVPAAALVASTGDRAPKRIRTEESEPAANNQSRNSNGRASSQQASEDGEVEE